MDELRSKLEHLAAEDKMSGVVLIVDRGEVVFRESYGFASRRWNVRCSPDIRFDTASITKLFTAVAVLQQIEAGRFDLETGAIDYLGLTDTSISPDVTVYQLLTHTSGIGDDADEEAGERYEDLWIDRPNYAIVETEDFLPQFVNKPPVFSAGAGCRYCNCSYVLLGLMVEKSSNSRYRDYIRSNVFRRAGMTSSDFFHRNTIEPAVAEGLQPVPSADGSNNRWQGNLYSYPPIGSPDGGAHVTADDLHRFLGALRGGDLLGPELTAEMFVPKAQHSIKNEDDVRHFGFGFTFQTTSSGTIRTFWKEGINVGVSGILRHYPAIDRTVVVLSNLEDGAWEPIRLIDEATEVDQ